MYAYVDFGSVKVGRKHDTNKKVSYSQDTINNY